MGKNANIKYIIKNVEHTNKYEIIKGIVSVQFLLLLISKNIRKVIYIS